jgi:hypothetical protein
VVYAEPPWPPIKREYIALAFGMFMLLWTVVATCTGKTWTRFHGWVYRAKDPKRYWTEIATGYVGGVGLIVFFLYQIHAFSK